jgi:uncharacterized lipoprotein YddW (UPF0748 family)
VSTGGWEGTDAYKKVLQDWRGWMEEGILDLNIPMNYKREHFVTEPNNQRRMYLEWNEFIKDHQYDRQAAIGPALYLNSIANSVIQVRKARAPSAAGNTAAGWVGYSYRTPSADANANAALGPAERAKLIRAFTQPSEYDPVTPPVFAQPAPVPEMTWKTQPAKEPLEVDLGDLRVRIKDQFAIVRQADRLKKLDVTPGSYIINPYPVLGFVGRNYTELQN